MVIGYIRRVHKNFISTYPLLYNTCIVFVSVVILPPVGMGSLNISDADQ
jgi:hypothetical protein